MMDRLTWEIIAVAAGYLVAVVVIILIWHNIKRHDEERER